jgi:hypothetical protein
MQTSQTLISNAIEKVQNELHIEIDLKQKKTTESIQEVSTRLFNLEKAQNDINDKL